ncbi:uncharacterized protein LOC131677495 [Topomyia yanbarensis]|uniref:uncharacterized protein LOC131677495 n=1 Tax=Topomyia yanbarensis TaxID=2498891 RepID=UPI00273A967C|nr:uncharacterized protein LOC131677495 [Topomyia yanbarensis]
MVHYSITIIVVAVLFLISTQNSASQQPDFRILAPKFICARSETQSNHTGPDDKKHRQITINLQTKGGQRLHYRVTVLFTLLDGFISQRHTIQLWRSVRQLEQRLRKQREQIADNNQIIIPHDDLVAGVIYTFNIVGIDDAGTMSDGQNFTITYRGKNARTSVDQVGSSSSNDVSLLLLGAEVSYSDVPYLLTAKLIFCKPRNDYKVKWMAPGVTDATGSLTTQSNMLAIPAGVLVPGTSYELTVTVIDSGNGEAIAGAKMKLSILKRVTKGILYPVEAITGFAQSTEIKAAFNRALDSNVTWSCEDSNGDLSCSQDLIVSASAVSVLFIKESRYTITISTEDFQTSSTIEVNPKSTITVSLQKLPPMYLVPGQHYEIIADVSGLVPKCTCNWTVVNEKGYSHFDSASVDTLGGIFINDIEENFLSELVDYGNDTVEREVKLIIPAMLSSANRTLLESNVLYKFRLITKCPEPIDDSTNYTDTNRGTVSSYWDMIVETNAPPEGQPLEIKPIDNGTAMSTTFTWSVGTAMDLEIDYPLKYSYWYTVEGFSINIANYYDVMSTETQLPYSTEKILPYYVVCDSREACSRVNGPMITVVSNPFLSETQIQFLLDAIRQKFKRGNYQETTKIAFETLFTLRNQASDNYNKTYSDMMIILEDQISAIQTAFLERSSYITETSVLQFAQQVKTLIDFKQGSNDHLLGQLLELVNCVEQGTTRQTRSADPKPITNMVDTTSTKIELYESLLKSPNRTSESKRTVKAQILSYIPEAAQRYCTNQQAGYSDDWFSLETTRLKPTSKYPLRASIRIPGDTTFPQRAVLSGSGGPKIETLADTASYLCLGTVLYHEDLLSLEAPSVEHGIYQVFMMVVDKYELGVLAEWKEGSYLWNITIASDGHSQRYRCQLWTDENTWAEKFCSSFVSGNYLFCNCTQMNYLRIISTNTTEITDVTTLSAIPTTSDVTNQQSTETSPATIFPETTTDTDMMTFAPLHSSSTVTKSIPTSIPTKSSTSTTKSPPTLAAISGHVANTSLDETSQLKANGTRRHVVGAVGPLGYSIVAALVLCGILTMLALVLYKRRRRTTTLAEELQSIAARVRSQSLPVRYARFHDEHNMIGENVSTISDTITV